MEDSQSTVGGVALVDLDDDGDLDALVSNGFRDTGSFPSILLWNDGSGQFSDSGQRLNATLAAELAVGDLDADGDLDVIVSNMDLPNEVWLNDGGQLVDSGLRLGESSNMSGKPSLGDLDGDGDLDLFVGSLAGRPEIWFNTTGQPTSVVTPTPAPASAAYWSIQALTPDYPIHTIEVAGTSEQIGCALGRWYQDRGFLPRPLLDDEQKAAREMLRFYDNVHPTILAQLRGLYAAYGLSLDDLQQAIPVSDNDGVRVLLPGLVENGSCSVIFTRPEMATDGHARLGRNRDWPGAPPDTYLVFTQPEGGYATVVMTAHTPGLSAADGLNSQGLALGFASVRGIGCEPPAGPALISGFAYRLILETCANVEEAIALLRSAPIAFIKSKSDDPITHLLLADRSGASAVVEFLPEGIIVSRSDAPYQVMTNSHWTGPADQPDCPRYQTAVEGLEEARGRIDWKG
jgi:predicted choloylglycine hydrolase